MNNNGELYAIVERQCRWMNDVKAGTWILRHKSAGLEVAKVKHQFLWFFKS